MFRGLQAASWHPPNQIFAGPLPNQPGRHFLFSLGTGIDRFLLESMTAQNGEMRILGEAGLFVDTELAKVEAGTLGGVDDAAVSAGGAETSGGRELHLLELASSNMRSQIFRTEILQGWLSISKPIRPGWLLTEFLLSSMKMDINWPFMMCIITPPRAMIW